MGAAALLVAALLVWTLARLALRPFLRPHRPVPGVRAMGTERYREGEDRVR